MQWDFQDKGKLGWTGKSSFVLQVPLRYLRPSVIYFVACDRIPQRVYCLAHTLDFKLMQMSRVNRENNVFQTKEVLN